MSFEPKMTTSLYKKSILIVEDDEILAMQLAENLSKAGYEVLEPVSTAINVVDKIKADPPTLILMDIELGKKRNEIEAIEEISRISDIPIIFIAGILEENAQNKAKIAASYGYLVKPVLERELNETIERALYKHKIDQQIKVSETRYRTLIEQASYGIFMINMDYEIVDVNEAGYQLLGYSKEELINKSLKDLIFFDDPNERILSFNEIQDQTIEIEYKIIHKDGTLIDVDIRGKFLEEGIFQAIVRDITERKKIEAQLNESHEQIEAMINASLDGFLIVDKKGKILKCNDQYCHMSGYSLEEMMTLSMRDLEISENKEHISEAVRITMQEGSNRFINQHRDKHGRVIDVEVSATFLKSRAYFLVIIRNITQKLMLEKSLEKRILALTKPLDEPGNLDFSSLFNLQEIQTLQDEFAKATCVSSIISQPDGTPITKPSNFSRLFEQFNWQSQKGLQNFYDSALKIRNNPEELIVEQSSIPGLLETGAAIFVGGHHIANWIIGQVRDRTAPESEIRRYANEIGVDPDDYWHAYQEVPNMPKENFQNVARALYTLANQLSGMAYQNVQQARFIVERNLAETTLRQSEERYRLLFEEMVEAFALHEVVLDEHGKPTDYIFLDVNPAFERLTGLKKEDIINKRVRTVLPNIESYWIETYGNVALKEEDIVFENYSVELDRWYTVVAFSPKKGQFATIFMDITDRKKSEETLLESEERFRKMFSEHDVPMFLIDPQDNSIVDANSGAEKYYGYPIEKLCAMKISDINPLSSDEMYKIIEDSNETNNKYLVFPNRLANGEIRMVEIYTTPIVINKNKVIYSIVHDITERIEAEKKLKNQLDELRRWHDVTLGREERIIELKREVNQLLKNHGQPSKYNSVEEN